MRQLVKYICLAVALALAGAAPVLAGSNTWTGSGPFANGLGNRVITRLAVTANGTLLAGSGSGTVFSYSTISLKPGDCDGNGSISIAEVQAAINMYLGIMPVSACVDTDNSYRVSIAEVQKVINGYLGL